MSAANSSTTTAAPVHGQPASPMDYIRSLAPEEKEAVFIVLLQELIEINGGGHGLIPLDFPGKASFGYLVPPEAARERFEKFISEFPPEVREEMTKPLPPDFDPNDVLSEEEVRAILRGEVLPESK